ncbi:CopG family transcriptional regulator [Nocardiopsis mangrovi]|uniref:CopG family transcriptional regulator n=1 Tax=Nocardiopsis mangrovi TaxID=1179818 RepID=A0ABV9DPQ6_9ACTN
MPSKRITVYADAEDLAVIREAARGRGVTDSEIIVEGIRLATMPIRVLDEPLNGRVWDGDQGSVGEGSALASGDEPRR